MTEGYDFDQSLALVSNRTNTILRCLLELRIEINLMNLLWDSHQEDSRHLLYEHGPHLSTMMVVVVVVGQWFVLVYVFVSPKLASCVCWSYKNGYVVVM